jgi:hypothetical protein
VVDEKAETAASIHYVYVCEVAYATPILFYLSVSLVRCL